MKNIPYNKRSPLIIIMSFVIIFGLLLTLTGCENLDSLTSPIDKSEEPTNNTTFHSDIKQQPLPYQQKKIMKLAPLDDKQRPQDAHIQLSFSQKPKVNRNERLDYNPPGWHNYRFKYKKQDGSIGKYWAFNRSHLVGYLFSGLNDEPKNLITGTTELNKGSENGMNQSNDHSMLYYESHLNHWLQENPDAKLDYQVTPLYRNNEPVPRQVRLAYVGYDKHGKRIPISFGTKEEQKGHNATVALLDNKQSNIDIDYKTGRAKLINKL